MVLPRDLTLVRKRGSESFAWNARAMLAFEVTRNLSMQASSSSNKILREHLSIACVKILVEDERRHIFLIRNQEGLFT